VSMEITRAEYDLLVKSIDGVSDTTGKIFEKIDKMFEKMEEIATKAIILEEWRKSHEHQTDIHVGEINTLKKRVSVLENYRWFLVGISIAVSSLIGIIIQLLMVLYGGK